MEAGLRIGYKWQPFPEEINRQVAVVVADLHYAPTEWSRQNLLWENISPEKIIVTGNPVIDALQTMTNQLAKPDVLAVLEQIGLPIDASEHSPRLVMITAHRREIYGAPMKNICAALCQLAEKYPEVRFVYPVHLNPNVHEPVYRLFEGISNMTLLPSLYYLPLVHLLKRAALVLTDSDGLQEEAPGLIIPIFMLRAVTKRPERVEAGTMKLVGTNTAHTVAEACRLSDDPTTHGPVRSTPTAMGTLQSESCKH